MSSEAETNKMEIDPEPQEQATSSTEGIVTADTEQTTNESQTKSQPPRRSTRLASQPKVEEPRPKPKRGGGSKKRAAAEEGGDDGEKDKSKSKKAKSEAKEDEETSTPVLAPIDIGDVLPSLVLKNEKGEDVQITDLTTEKGVVMFLVPKANTPGCTTQACGFRDIYSEFAEHGYAVYCLSADSPHAQNNWQTLKELPYPLISDPKRVLITALGAGEGGKTKRSHFIFEKGGKLVDKKIPVKPVDSPKLALEFIKNAATGGTSS